MSFPDSTKNTPASRASDTRNKPSMERLLVIHRHLRQGLGAPHLSDGMNGKKNASCFAKELGCSSKTIVRDIAFMRDRMGLPLEYDESRHTYYYTKEVTEFPLMKITEGELTALFVAKAALHQYKGAPYEGALRSALGKLEDSLKSEMDVDLDAIGRAISFRHAGSPVKDVALFETLADAAMHRKVLSFDYRKGASATPERRTVHPYHLAHYGTRWYLVAYDESRGSIRQYVLGRITAVQPAGRSFPPPRDFSPESYYQNSFGVFVSGGEHAVRLRFSPNAAESVREGDWHPSQCFADMSGGGCEMTLRVSSLDEVARWVLGFGGEAEALAPAALRDRVRLLASELAVKHA